MANPALYEEWIASVHRLRQAQRLTGIHEAIADLSGRNADAYARKAGRFAADYRRAVFAIPNQMLRLRLIREDRENYRIYKAYRESELGGLRERARPAGAHTRYKHLWIAAGFGACLVLLAGEIWGPAAAQLGAVIALLVAVDHFRRAEWLAASEEAATRPAAAESASGSLHPLARDDGSFSQTEAETGVADNAEQYSTLPLEPLHP
jgi:hypothetical protein